MVHIGVYNGSRRKKKPTKERMLTKAEIWHRHTATIRGDTVYVDGTPAVI